ncbi:hypothetical protein VTN00DRAFT_1509 [Thermoascus crustaceus]|uniref:uncharacterized protein n=1 Tax=Thermoascus crustaceus TaxID=5088 RepID=UPI0037433BCB
MQSFLQYRRFGKLLEAQIERNREKTAELRRQRRQADAPTADDSSEESTLDGQSMEEKEEQQPDGDYHVSPSRIASQPLEQMPSRQSLPEVETAGDLERADFDAPPDLEAVATQDTMGTTLGISLTGVEVRSRTTKEGGPAMGKVFVVSYEGDKDPMNPRNWPFAKRLACTLVISLIGGVVGFASSIDSAALPQGMEAFGVSDVAEFLATGIFLIGFGTGALISGPFSETLGRNPVYIGTLAIYMLFIMGAGLAPNLGTQLVCRFFAGLFGSTPLVCAGGSLSDLWTPIERVYAFPIFACSAFVGPPETYHPVLLKWKAQHLRRLTGDKRYRAAIEVRQTTFLYRLGHALYRPFLLLFREPIIILVALYLTVIYIILSTFLTGYTFIFTDTYHFSQGLTGVCFVGISIGVFLAGLLIPLAMKLLKRDLARALERGQTRPPPETRLYFAIYQYVIDSYEEYAASALASVTLIRYVAAGAMIEVSLPFYKNLGVAWTLTILGALSALLVPVPYVFFKFGPAIRKRSHYASL